MACVAACTAGNPAPTSSAGDSAPGDGGLGGAGDAPGNNAGSDSGATGSDGGVDAPPSDQNPFPVDPQGGEFAWVVSGSGAGDTLSVAVDPMGNIVVAAQQTGEVTFGSVHVPRPSSPEAVLVLKLTADGKPVWAHTFDGHPQFNPRSITTTPTGNVVVGATFRGDAPVPFPPLGQYDGFIAMLDGATGEPRWSSVLASGGDDSVVGVAAGLDAAGDGALYVYGQLGSDTMISGQALSAGAYLIRYDDDGTLRWGQSFPNVHSGFNNTLALDAVRGPVITGTGTLASDLTLDDPTISSEGAVVAGFDPDGHVRFVRPVLSAFSSFHHSIAVAPSGEVYLASETSRTETVIDDHVIPIPDFIDHSFLARLTADGHYVSSTLITGNRDEAPGQLATDATGAAYMITTCNGQVNVQPEITCDPDGGGVIVSYGPDNAYRWATYVKSAFVESIAAAPGNRMIVAGQALGNITDFGGVRVPTQKLFIAALAGGAARPPSPLPAAPSIASAALDSVSDGQIRQGDTRTLMIQGTALDHVTSARLGDIDIHVPPNAGTASQLRLAVMIPHGHAPGPLSLMLGNAGGSAQVAGVVTVTPIVVTASGSDSGRGTFTSPMLLCGSSISFARYGDVVLLKNGVHACNSSIGLPDGVTVRGETKEGTIVQGINGANDRFGGFDTGGSTMIGAAAVENMTIGSADLAAVNLFFGGKVTVTDVDVVGAAGSGVWVAYGGTATLTRFRYLQSTGTAIVLFSGGRVDATEVYAEGVYRGVLMDEGTLNLSGSFLSSSQSAVQAGDLNPSPGTREVNITNTTLRSSTNGISGGTVQLTVSDSTIEPLASDNAEQGITLYGGTLTLTNSSIHGWRVFGIFAWPHFDPAARGLSRRSSASVVDDPDAVNLTLDHAEITSSLLGINYDTLGTQGRFSLHNSHVQGADSALSLSGAFTADLGTAALPGNNQLEVDSGEPALSDGRSTAGPAVDAHGTTLNGVSYSGDVLGPAAAAGYQISGPNTIHF